MLLVASTQAAAPELEPAIVTESRTYERQTRSFSVGGLQAAGKSVSMSRVTLAIDGMLVTAEWEPKTSISTTAKDFRRGSEVRAAIQRNRLLLQAPDGSLVTARIVDRERPNERARD